MLSLDEDGKFINLSVSMNGGNDECTIGRLDAATGSGILHLFGQKNLIFNREKSGKRCLCQPCKVLQLISRKLHPSKRFLIGLSMG